MTPGCDGCDLLRDVTQALLVAYQTRSWATVELILQRIEEEADDTARHSGA